MTTLDRTVVSGMELRPTPDADRAAAMPRLRLCDPDVAGFVDGAWWPQSCDLQAELPSLLEAMLSAGYAVRRVAYNLGWWAIAPRRLTVLGRVVHLGGYRTQDVAAISLIDSSGWKRVELVVIPPQTDARIAERVFVLACAAGDPHRAGEILDLARDDRAPLMVETNCVDLLPTAEWESDGGPVLSP